MDEMDFLALDSKNCWLSEYLTPNNSTDINDKVEFKFDLYRMTPEQIIEKLGEILKSYHIPVDPCYRKPYLATYYYP